ncbi:MAG: DUF817 domain-containing protein [Neisseriaceae bacterium]|nr:DUF817 domain-containing protein [Neisseriaceae bacterium]
MHWLSLKKIPLAELKQQLLSPSRQHSSFWALLYSFTLKQAWASLFGGLLLGFIVLFHFVYPRDAWLSQNDALTLVAIAIQVLMLAFKLETFKELRVILLFHLVGTVMELFKTSMGSWTYGAAGVLHIGAVPLFTGFMYGAVGSYMVRVYRGFHLRFSHYPPQWVNALVALAIYVNFFTHHYVYDARWLILAVIVLVYGRTTMYFRVRVSYLRMPLILSFFLVAFFIWIAENVATYSGAWLYPNQLQGWHMVSAQKIVSWFLLMIISVALVTWVYPPHALSPRQQRRLNQA